MKERDYQVAVAVLLIIFGVSLRLMPHPANFAPIAAIAIFGGSILPRRFAVWVPMVAMIFSDIFIGFYSIMPIIWGCYAVIALVSSYGMAKFSIKKLIAITLGSSVFFFTVSNFAVWIFGGMYSISVQGLIYCYEMALPFFRNTGLSDLTYTALLFGLYWIAMKAGNKYIVLKESRN